MININFVCHGNICRSPMAEFVLKDLIKKENLQDKFYIHSSATSYEEIGNPVHTGTKKVLAKNNIPVHDKVAIKLEESDYTKDDYFIGMDHANVRNMKKLFHGDPDHKVHKLLDFVNEDNEIADPWYTGDFNLTYDDVYRGCVGFLDYLKETYTL